MHILATETEELADYNGHLFIQATQYCPCSHKKLNYQLDIQNCKILCFTESWLNVNTINIQLAGYTLYRQDRTSVAGKTRLGGL